MSLWFKLASKNVPLHFTMEMGCQQSICD